MQSLNFVTSWQQAVISVTSNLLNSIVLFLPNIIGALIIFILGFVFGNWLKILTVKLLQLLQISHLFQDTKLPKFLKEAGITTKIEQAVGQGVRLLTIFVFIVAAVNILGLTTVTLVLTNILNYIPNVIAAILILALGTILAGVVESVVKGSLGVADLKTSRLLGKTSSYIVIVFSILAALSQLRIAQDFVNIIFIGLVATLSISLGLGIGLGSKDVISEILADWYKQFKKDTQKK